ncbi:MAG: hypothetical protein CSA74_10665 [Rhodobacterales bacterium]|nr:MAG: hypothetical protein CSA74_10665 [Rhodobacterales bacterium]
MRAHIFKALAVLAASVTCAAAPATGLDAEKWVAAHPAVGVLTAETVLTVEAPGTTLDDFHWTARPLVVFADSADDPRFIQQMEFIARDGAELAARDVIVVVDTDPAAGSALREELRPRGFMLVLIGKDGFKYLRKPRPWNVREISRSIDKMPLRQQEVKDARR